jgi:hypothetical protein
MLYRLGFCSDTPEAYLSQRQHYRQKLRYAQERKIRKMWIDRTFAGPLYHPKSRWYCRPLCHPKGRWHCRPLYHPKGRWYCHPVGRWRVDNLYAGVVSSGSSCGRE